MERVKNKLFWLYTRQITELLLKIRTVAKNQGDGSNQVQRHVITAVCVQKLLLKFCSAPVKHQATTAAQICLIEEIQG